MLVPAYTPCFDQIGVSSVRLVDIGPICEVDIEFVRMDGSWSSSDFKQIGDHIAWESLPKAAVPSPSLRVKCGEPGTYFFRMRTAVGSEVGPWSDVSAPCLITG